MSKKKKLKNSTEKPYFSKTIICKITWTAFQEMKKKKYFKMECLMLHFHIKFAIVLFQNYVFKMFPMHEKSYFTLSSRLKGLNVVRILF